MVELGDDFLETEFGLNLYNQSIILYKKIERENARVVNVNGIDMGYLEFGSSTGVPLIWSHGSALTSYEIINVQARLVEAGYRVISIDYRGHGKTQIEVNGYNTSLYHIADDIAALMDHLGISKAVLGGLSKGGAISTAFYDAYPSRALGLLLEDGGSWSGIRWRDDKELKTVQLGTLPCQPEVYDKLCSMNTYQTRIEALTVALKAYSPALTADPTVEFLTHLLALHRQKPDGTWIHHCDIYRLCCNETTSESGRFAINDHVYFSRLPLMQQSHVMILPLQVFRNLNVPVHIIDPVSPSDWIDVRHQNEELQAQHPDWIVHEVYDYEHSPHEAHLGRPDRFIESAKALLERVRSK